MRAWALIQKDDNCGVVTIASASGELRVWPVFPTRSVALRAKRAIGEAKTEKWRVMPVELSMILAKERQS